MKIWVKIILVSACMVITVGFMLGSTVLGLTGLKHLLGADDPLVIIASLNMLAIAVLAGAGVPNLLLLTNAIMRYPE